MHWTEHPVAIISDHSYDTKCVDTGSVFQHPNGTVYAVFATINATSNSAAGSVDGDICLARALDPLLVKWEMLCDQQPFGKIRSPICDWQATTIIMLLVSGHCILLIFESNCRCGQVPTGLPSRLCRADEQHSALALPGYTW